MTRLVGVVLAAGAGARLESEQAKPLLDWSGQPLVCRVVERLLQARVVEAVWVTTGSRGREVAQALAAMCRDEIVTVDVPDWREGQAASLRAVAERLLEANRGAAANPASITGLLVTLADRPFLAAADYRKLAETWRASPHEAVTCQRGDEVRLPPAILPLRSEGIGEGSGEGARHVATEGSGPSVADLLDLAGDRGARGLLAEARTVEISERAAIDIDTLADYSRWHPS